MFIGREACVSKEIDPDHSGGRNGGPGLFVPALAAFCDKAKALTYALSRVASGLGIEYPLMLGFVGLLIFHSWRRSPFGRCLKRRRSSWSAKSLLSGFLSAPNLESTSRANTETARASSSQWEISK
jgi:hypothetical protein